MALKCPECKGSIYTDKRGDWCDCLRELPPEYNHLLHLTLTWAARGLLIMTDDWRNRRVLLSGKRVSDEVEMAANALYAQGLVFVTSGIAFAAPLGTIAVTNEGSGTLAEWDARAAGAVGMEQ